MQAILPQHWGAAVAQSATTLSKAAARHETIATVVGGHVLQFVGEGAATAKPAVAAQKAAARLARPKVAPTPRRAAKPGVPAAAAAPTRRAAQPMAKSLSPAAPITNAAPELMFKSFSALDRASQLDAELRERLAHPGKFL